MGKRSLNSSAVEETALCRGLRGGGRGVGWLRFGAVTCPPRLVTWTKDFVAGFGKCPSALLISGARGVRGPECGRRVIRGSGVARWPPGAAVSEREVSA